MNEFLGIIALLLCLLVGYVVSMRVTKPHSKKMARAPEESTSTATPSKQNWFMKYLWTIMLVIAGLVVFFWGIYSSEAWESPSFSVVGSWSWNHWLQLLILYGIGSAILRLNKEALGSAESILQTVLGMVMLGAFLVCPTIGWIGNTTIKSQSPMTLSMSPGGKSERIPVPFQMRVTISGNDYRHHCVYADGHEESFVLGERPCSSGNMPFVYATNLRAKDSNVITYSYQK